MESSLVCEARWGSACTKKPMSKAAMFMRTKMSLRNASQPAVPLERADLQNAASFTAEPIAIIEQGSFGTVVLARCPEFGDKLCAVKVMHLRDSDGNLRTGMQQSYLRELAVLIRLTGIRYVQTLLGYDETPDYAFIATEYCSNRDLFTLQNSYDNYKLPEELARFYFAEICEGIRQIHLRGFMHRDIKPENIFIDHHGHVKIGDFGLAKECDGTYERAGTPDYFSPERLKKEFYDKSCDYWSAGVTLFVTLFGCFPYDSDSFTPQGLSDKVTVEPLINMDFCDDDVTNNEAYEFLKEILAVDITKRLGCGPNGFENLISHPYLADYDFTMLAQGKLPPPIIPFIKQSAGLQRLNETIPPGKIRLQCL